MNQPDYLISTPENVDLHIELAGAGNRCLACLIDVLIAAVVNLVAFILIVLVIIGIESQGFIPQAYRSVVEIVLVALLIFFCFLVSFAYFIYFEGRWQGQTPGKKFAGIRVIEANGQPVTWSAVFIRNLIRVVELYLFAVGLIPMLIDRSERRFGDIAAGTIVIRERGAELAAKPLLTTAQKGLWFDIGQVSPDDYQLLTEFLKRRQMMDPEERLLLANKMLSYFEKKLSATFEKVNPEQMLESIYSTYLAQAQISD